VLSITPFKRPGSVGPSAHTAVYSRPPMTLSRFRLTPAGGGRSADAMWGPTGGPQWVAHDPSKNAQKLKGVAVYDGASGGGAGRHIRKNGVPSGNRIAEGLMSR